MARVIKYLVSENTITFVIVKRNIDKADAQFYLNWLKHQGNDKYKLFKKTRNTLVYQDINSKQETVKFVYYKICETKSISANPKDVVEIQKLLRIRP